MENSYQKYIDGTIVIWNCFSSKF